MTIQGMYDTVAAWINPPSTLSDDLFDGGIVRESFAKMQVSARLFRNPPEGVYEPRVTYWRKHGSRTVESHQLGEYDQEDDVPSGFLKLEFSIPKMLGFSPLRIITEAEAQQSLDRVDEFNRRAFGDLPPIREWIAQRIDYCHMWDVSPNLIHYMIVLSALQVNGMSRHPFEASEGVVWKSRSSRGRWIKFYNKTAEAGLSADPDAPQLLRFEVSNFKDSVRYIADQWFDAARTVDEFIRPGRALYVLASQFDKLGLSRADRYGREPLLLSRLRESFGERGVAPAYYVLTLMRSHGAVAYDSATPLVSKSTYYRWRGALVDAGFVTLHPCVDDDDADNPVISERVVLRDETLPPLRLPLFDVLCAAGENLTTYGSTPGAERVKNSEISPEWEYLRNALDIYVTRPSKFLMTMFQELSDHERRQLS